MLFRSDGLDSRTAVTQASRAVSGLGSGVFVLCREGGGLRSFVWCEGVGLENVCGIFGGGFRECGGGLPCGLGGGVWRVKVPWWKSQSLGFGSMQVQADPFEVVSGGQKYCIEEPVTGARKSDYE